MPHKRQLVQHRPKELAPSFAIAGPVPKNCVLGAPVCPSKPKMLALFAATVEFLVEQPQVAVVRIVAVHVMKQALLMSVVGWHYSVSC